MNAYIFYSHAELESQATEIAQRFNFILQGSYHVDSITEHLPHITIPILNLTPEGLMLHSPNMKPWCVDFLSAQKNYRRKYGGGFKEALARACDVKPHKELPLILDLTAGFAKDAFVLACLGCHITLVERHPVIAALVDDALKRLYQDPIRSSDFHLNLIFDEAEHYLLNRSSDCISPDIIYLDPMHPERSKSAHVKKDMQILQAWISPEENPEHLVNLSLQYAKKRVVLKWPRKAPSLKQKPHFFYEEKTVRFDVYTPSK